MMLERNGNLAELVGIFLTSGSIDHEILTISIEKNRYEYVDHVVKLMRLIFNMEPLVIEHYEKALISISDREAIQAFKKDALEM